MYPVQLSGAIRQEPTTSCPSTKRSRIRCSCWPGTFEQSTTCVLWSAQRLRRCHQVTALGRDVVAIGATRSQRQDQTGVVRWFGNVLMVTVTTLRHARSLGATVSYCHRVTALEESMHGLLVYQCLIIKGSQRWKRACMVYWCNNVLLSKGNSARRKHAWSIGVTVSYYQRVTGLEESMHGLLV